MAKPFFEYQGSAKKPYRVVLFQKGVIPSCTCVSYKTRLNKNANLAGGGFKGAGTGLAGSVTAWCKHLEHFSKTVCQWELTDEHAIAPASCPRCNGPVIDDDGKAVVDVGQATNGLLAIVADLSGREIKDVEPETDDDDDEPDEVLAPEPVGKADFDANLAVAELAAMLKTAK
jgi:hypothetical protein